MHFMHTLWSLIMQPRIRELKILAEVFKLFENTQNSIDCNHVWEEGEIIQP